jgi:hypothetical protein
MNDCKNCKHENKSAIDEPCVTCFNYLNWEPKVTICTVCNKNESEWVCVECGKHLCNNCAIHCHICNDIFCPNCIKMYSMRPTHVCSTCKDVNEHKFITSILKKEIIRTHVDIKSGEVQITISKEQYEQLLIDSAKLAALTDMLNDWNNNEKEGG